MTRSKNQVRWLSLSSLAGILTLVIVTQPVNIAWAQPVHSDEVTLSVVQFPVEGSKTFEKFFSKIEGYATQAKKAGADLVVFPELSILDTLSRVEGETDQHLVEQIAADVTPRFFGKVSDLSKKLGLTILAGSAPNRKNGKLYNTALMAFPDGRKVFQDKIFPTRWERTQGIIGGDSIEVFDTPWGRTAILICYDVEFPMISESLVKSSPEILLVPSMTISKEGFNRVRWAAQARAVEHYAYVVVTGTVGKPTFGWPEFGQGVLLTPQDVGFPGLLAEGVMNQAEVLTGTIQLKKLRASRISSRYYPARDQLERTEKVGIKTGHSG